MGMPNKKKPFLAWYAMLQATTRLTERINAELEAEAGIPAPTVGRRGTCTA